MTCPMVTQWLNAFAVPDNCSVGAIVEAQCATGTRFYDGTTEKSATCQADGTWSVVLSDCEMGKDNSFYRTF